MGSIFGNPQVWLEPAPIVGELLSVSPVAPPQQLGLRTTAFTQPEGAEAGLWMQCPSCVLYLRIHFHTHGNQINSDNTSFSVVIA